MESAGFIAADLSKTTGPGPGAQQEFGMIKLTRLNGEEFVVNAELIRFVESRPDTYVTLTTDDRLIVRESVEEVMQRVISYARHIRMLPETAAQRLPSPR